MSELRYDSDIDLSVDNAHTRVIRLVGAGKRVLDLGCASGSLGQVLIGRFGCEVTGVECDGEAVVVARRRGLRVIEGDLDTIDLAAVVGGERFEVALCADVLEHLREPGRTLRALGGLLTPGGYLVASVPNIAHISIMAELLEGRFAYRPFGLLDTTHLRFFTRSSLLACFRETGFVVTRLERVCLEPELTEFRTDLSRFPPEVQAIMRTREEGTTYQFIVRAEPAVPDPIESAPASAQAAATLYPRNVEGEGRADAARTWMRFLEEERDRQRKELEAFRGWAAQLQDGVRERDARLAVRDAELAERDARVAERDARVAERDARLLLRDIELAERGARLDANGAQLAECRSRLVEAGGEITRQAAEIEALKRIPLRMAWRRLRARWGH